MGFVREVNHVLVYLNPRVRWKWKSHKSKFLIVSVGHSYPLECRELSTGEASRVWKKMRVVGNL
jgi:hypothetical protein